MHYTQFISRALIGACFFTTAAFADLVPASPFEVNLNGTGFGNVETLITLQTANGQTTTEAGCIGFNDSTTNCGITTDGKIKNTSTTEPVPTGITADELRFIFNAAEPQGGSMSLNTMDVSFYGTSSTPLYTAVLGSPMTLTSTQQGTGNSGFVFELNPTQATAVQSILSSTTQIGAGFGASGASGGQDTLFLATSPSSASTPEPRNYAWLLAAFIAGCVLLRHRRSSRVIG